MEREFAEPVNDYREHNKALELSPDYQKIMYLFLDIDGVLNTGRVTPDQTNKVE